MKKWLKRILLALTLLVLAGCAAVGVLLLLGVVGIIAVGIVSTFFGWIALGVAGLIMMVAGVTAVVNYYQRRQAERQNAERRDAERQETQRQDAERQEAQRQDAERQNADNILGNLYQIKNAEEITDPFKTANDLLLVLQAYPQLPGINVEETRETLSRIIVSLQPPANEKDKIDDAQQQLFKILRNNSDEDPQQETTVITVISETPSVLDAIIRPNPPLTLQQLQ